MKRVALFLLFIAIMAGSVSCTKAGEEIKPEESQESIAVTIVSPAQEEAAKQSFQDVVPVIAEITSDGSLHEYQLRIIRLEDGIQVFASEVFHSHDEQVSLDYKWQNTLGLEGQVLIQVVATNHYGKLFKDEREIALGEH